MDEQREKKEEIKYSIKFFLLNAKHNWWTQNCSSKLYGNLIRGIVPGVEIELENILDNDEYLDTGKRLSLDLFATH